MVKLFRQESVALSHSKRDLEAHLQTLKHQLHALDSTRKLLQNKISSLSKSLQFSAQRFKVQCNSQQVTHSISLDL